MTAVGTSDSSAPHLLGGAQLLAHKDLASARAQPRRREVRAASRRQCPDTLAPMQDDLGLVEKWRAGDEEAGQELLGRHFDDVYRFFRNKCATESDDLVQRTFLEIVKSRDSFRAESSFRTFLFVIARRVLYGYLRKQKRDDALDFGVTSLGEIVTSVGTKMARNEAAERLRQALEELPVDDQVLIELRYWHELDATALGEVFECPSATIRTRLRRARLKLQEKLGEDEATASIFRDMDESD